MSENQHSHHQHGDPNGGNIHQGQRPYWTRAHRDWRVWVGVVLMIACMIIYLMSDDLALRPRIQAQPPLSSAVGK
jgi:hypothetical protein